MQTGEHILIRAYAPEDAANLQTIRAEAFAPVFASFRALLGDAIAAVALANAEQEQAALLQRLCSEDPNATVFVAERDGRAIGFVAVTFDRKQRMGEIVLIAVAPGAAGRGAGSALIAQALAAMRTAGLRAAVVGAGADASHAPALRAYEKAGFIAGIPSKHLYRVL
jgi:ribosomal protein S18 acetylase RimI-like enzyme